MISATEPVVIMTRREFDDLVERVARRAAEETARRLPASRPQHVTKTDAAKLLKVSIPTVSKMIKFGTLSLNDCGRIPIEQIDRALEARAA